MNIELKLYYELYRKLYDTAELLRKSFNPLREYDDEFIEGPVLDLGCGQSNFAFQPRQLLQALQQDAVYGRMNYFAFFTATLVTHNDRSF